MSGKLYCLVTVLINLYSQKKPLRIDNIYLFRFFLTFYVSKPFQQEHIVYLFIFWEHTL